MATHTFFQRVWRCAVACFTGLALGRLALPAHADTLPLGATEWPPFQYIDPHGKPVGADTELVEAVVRHMGHTPLIKVQPWARIEPQGVKGELAGIFSVIKTPEREKSFIYTDPISTSRTVFFKRKGHDIQWRTLSDLRAYRVGLAAGYAYPPVFAEAVKTKGFKAVLESYGSSADLSSLKSLQKGVVDLVICELSVCQFIIQTHADELGEIDHISTLVGTELPMYLAISKKWPNAAALAQSFNTALAHLVATGTRKKILKKYDLHAD